jgi:hypothetical protein
LHRQGPKICANMVQLHKALIGLLDESGPIENRIDEAWDLVPGMGRAIITAILLVTHPTKYGVWNRISEEGLKVLGLWPHFDRGESLGKRYMRINKILLSLAGDLRIDLWTLDALWWSLFEDRTSGEIDSDVAAEFPGFIFDEERHLQWFLVQNWDKLSLSREWNIYSEPGNDMAGCEYRCSVGRIDILARHRTESDWLVIELKRDQTSDITVGQVLRYIGCIKKEMAQPGEIVRGLVIAREADMSLLYALDTVQNVKLQLYEIQFNLRPAIGSLEKN